MYFKIKILENNSEYFEEKDSDWMKNPEKFIDLKEELAILNDNFSASFNLNEVGAKNINVSEMKRFVDDVDSDKINNEKNSIKRYLKYIYPDKQFLDTRSVTEKIKIRKGKDKGKEKTTNSYTKKKINVFGIQCLELLNRGQKVKNLILQQVVKTCQKEKKLKLNTKHQKQNHQNLKE